MLALALPLNLGAAPSTQADEQLIGTSAKEWTLTDWQGSAPLKLAELRGRVVLVRWWTAPGCRYCRATAPALNEFHAAYRDKGLVVVGAYHHKSSRPLRVEEVKASAREFGFEFPVAIDRDWRTLKRWWLDGAGRDFTSVSFLIDRKGVIRHIHPGGQYVKGDADYAALKAKLEELLTGE